MSFDPSQPFEVESSGFDPGQPFEIEPAPTQPAPKRFPVVDSRLRLINSISLPEWAAGPVAAFGQGLSLGGADEVQAAIEAAGGETSYTDSIARQKAEREAYSREHPYIAGFSTAAGAVAPVVASTLAGTIFGTPAGGLAAATGTGARAFQLTRQALGIEGAQSVGRANTVMQAAKEGARAAATPATVAGALTADPGERDIGAAIGLGTGLAFGGALGGTIAAGQKASPYLERVARWLGVREVPVVQAVPSGPGGSPPITRAEEAILRRMEEGGVTPEAAAAALDKARRAGVPLALVDVGGQPIQRQARGIRALPGEASATIDEALSRRAAGQNQRVVTHLERGLGRKASGNAGQVVDDLLTQARRDSAPIYRELDNLPEITSDKVDEIFQRPVVRDFVQRAESAAADYGGTVRPLYAEDGTLARRPTFSDVNRVKQELDLVLKPTYTAGPRPTTGTKPATAQEQNLARQLRRELITTVDKLPGGDRYRAAREAFSEPMRARAAYEAGVKASATKTDAKGASLQDAKAFINKASPFERKWFERGVMEGMRRRVMNVSTLTGNRNTLSEVWASPEQANKLRTIVRPTRNAMLEERLGMENKAVQTSNFIRGGSQTTDKAMDVADVVVDSIPTSPRGAAMTALQKSWDYLRKNVNESTRLQIAQAVSEMDPAQQQAFLTRLADLRRQGQVNADQVATIANLVTRQQSTGK